MTQAKPWLSKLAADCIHPSVVALPPLNLRPPELFSQSSKGSLGITSTDQTDNSCWSVCEEPLQQKHAQKSRGPSQEYGALCGDRQRGCDKRERQRYILQGSRFVPCRRSAAFQRPRELVHASGVEPHRQGNVFVQLLLYQRCYPHGCQRVRAQHAPNVSLARNVDTGHRGNDSLQFVCGGGTLSLRSVANRIPTVQSPEHVVVLSLNGRPLWLEAACHQTVLGGKAVCG
mmetsp:Transcript_27146/g.62594  ORF Transcript_27146/g.62594 Transcript_27146/m.62594 type:complete len:230 (-) Transcript_27146:564-1253(-)